MGKKLAKIFFCKKFYRIARKTANFAFTLNTVIPVIINTSIFKYLSYEICN